MKTKSLNILIVALLLIGIMSIMLIIFLYQAHEKFPQNITVNADDKTETIFSVQDLRLTPTQSKEYEVNLVCDASGAYNIFLEYEETYDGGMKPFVDVTVFCHDNVIYEGALSELLDGGKIVEFEGELASKDPLVVKIRYEMPGTTGNEAKGTSADFDVHIKIKKI